MSDLHAAAPQPSRAAQYVRAGRATSNGATDITSAFDQIFANTAQPAPQARPQVAQPTVDAPIDATFLDLGKRGESPNSEEPAADEVAVERLDAPRYEALPARQEQRNDAARVDAPKHVAPPTGLVSAKAVETQSASRTTDRPSSPRTKQPGATDARRTLSPEKTLPEAPPQPSQQGIANRVEQVIPAAARRAAAIRSAEQKTSETRLAETRAIERPTAAKPVGIPVAATLTSTSATAVRGNRMPREAEHVAPRPEAPAILSTKAKDSAHPVVAKALSAATAPLTPTPEVANFTSTQLARRSKSRNESKPLAGESSAATAKVAASKVARTEPVETANIPKSSENQRVESKSAVQTAVAETKSAKLAAQAVGAVAVESQPAPRVDEGAQVEARRARETRTTPVANPEIKNGDAPPIATSNSNTVAQPPVVLTAPAASATTTVAPTLSLESASVGKTTNTSSQRADQRAAPEATTPASASRESGKSPVDTAKATAPPRARTDQQQEVDRVRLVQRVAKAVQTAQDRGAPLRLRLTPPELGVLRIELIVRDGALSARLEAETPAAKTAILENLSALRERLTAQEIKIERFDVDLMQQPDNSGGGRKSFADAESSREQAAARQFRIERATENKSAHVPESKPNMVRHTAGQLNVLA